MTHYTVCCGYASHYHNTVTVEADTFDEALEKAIEQAGDDPHWKSVDQASQTFVEALAEGMDANPWGDTALPVPDRFTGEPANAIGSSERANGEPPVVTLTGPRTPGGIEVAGGTVRIRFVEHAGTVTTEATDPPAPPGNKPLVTDPPQSRWRSGCGRRAETVHACSFWIPATPDRRRTVDRRRHSSIANRLPCATPSRGPAFGLARTAGARVHPDDRYSRGPFHETVH